MAIHQISVMFAILYLQQYCRVHGLRDTVLPPHISKLYRYNVASKMNLFDKINDIVIADILK